MTTIAMTTTVTLGKNGPIVSALGLGTWAWGDSLFWGYGKTFGQAEVAAAFQASVQAGITFIDTAEVYGLGTSEQLIGEFCQQHSGESGKSGEQSSPVQIATKYFPLPWRWNREAITEALTASLKRLQMSRITLYQIHWPLEFFLRTKDFMAVLAEEVKNGRIEAIGVSNYNAEQLQQAYDYLAERGIPLASNQVNYSLLQRNIEENGVFAKAKALGVTILAYSPLAQGLLTGKYTAATIQDLQGARRLDPRFSVQGLARLKPQLTVLEEIASQRGKTPSQVALNWLIAQGNVIPIPGAKNALQAQQNAGALGWTLTAEEIQRLSTAFR
ncbi:MAG: aldo/keto reductase [Prochlorotrichaceae cyanobacterium]